MISTEQLHNATLYSNRKNLLLQKTKCSEKLGRGGVPTPLDEVVMGIPNLTETEHRLWEMLPMACGGH